MHTAKATGHGPGSKTHGASTKGGTHPIVPTRTLLLAVIAKAEGANLFGGAALFDPKYTSDGVEIPDGNVATFLTPRVQATGVKGVTTPTEPKLDDAIAAWGYKLYQATNTGDPNPQQLHWICLEYVISSCFRKPTEMEPFASYLADARKYRAAVKALRAAAENSTDEAFDNPGEIAEVIRKNADGFEGWAKIASVLATSPHVAIFRSNVVAPPLYTTADAWKAMAALEADQRPAALGELYAMIANSGNPIVSVRDVEMAIARAKGNLLLTEGNAFGVQLATIVKSTGDTALTKVRKNGGEKIEVEGSPAAIGASFAGLQGHAIGAIETDGKILTYGFSVQEGQAGKKPTMIMVPAPMRTAYPQPQATL